MQKKAATAYEPIIADRREMFGSPQQGSVGIETLSAAGGFVSNVEEGRLVVTFSCGANAAGSVAVSLSSDVAAALVDLVAHQLARSVGCQLSSENTQEANFPGPSEVVVDGAGRTV